MDFPILTTMMLVPLAGAIACLFAGQASRIIALGATLITFVLGVLLWANYEIGGAQWNRDAAEPWNRMNSAQELCEEQGQIDAPGPGKQPEAQAISQPFQPLLQPNRSGDDPPGRRSRRPKCVQIGVADFEGKVRHFPRSVALAQAIVSTAFRCNTWPTKPDVGTLIRFCRPPTNSNFPGNVLSHYKAYHDLPRIHALRSDFTGF